MIKTNLISLIVLSVIVHLSVVSLLHTPAYLETFRKKLLKIHYIFLVLVVTKVEGFFKFLILFWFTFQ